MYGCDDCQLACPWNRFARTAAEADFRAVRNGLDRATLVELFAWTREEFDTRLAGSAIRRIGYERWLRNIAVGLGNAPRSAEVVAALRARADDPSPLVREHVAWALARHAAPHGRTLGGCAQPLRKECDELRLVVAALPARSTSVSCEWTSLPSPSSTNRCG